MSERPEDIGGADAQAPTPETAPSHRPPPQAEVPAHAPPRGAHAMNIVRWVLFAGLLALAAISIASYVAWRAGAGAGQKAGQKAQAKYFCPMHPSYTSDRPGECPICGMSLEPIPAGGIGQSASGPGSGDVPGLTSVHLSPERVQLIGIRTAVVTKRPLGSRRDLVGFVTPDETRLQRIQLRVAGWIQKLYVSRTGERVAAGDPLLAIYSPELYQSEQEFLIELGSPDGMAHAGHDPGSEAARERLRLLGVPEAEISRLARERTASTGLVLRSPVAGTVLERGVTEGEYVSADTPLYTLADLSRVWVVADLYEMDLQQVRVGDRATFTAGALPGREFAGRVEFVSPTVSSTTRTVKARIPFANADGTLRPGMFGRVAVESRGSVAPAVPAEAVIHTGEHDYVFFAHADGHFEPRMVWTGARDGEWVQVLRGIAEGDTVVTSASFLLDSESRLKAAIAGAGSQPAAGHRH